MRQGAQVSTCLARGCRGSERSAKFGRVNLNCCPDAAGYGVIDNDRQILQHRQWGAAVRERDRISKSRSFW